MLTEFCSISSIYLLSLALQAPVRMLAVLLNRIPDTVCYQQYEQAWHTLKYP